MEHPYTWSDAEVADSLTLRLEQSAVPVNTTEGRIQWDTDDDRLVVGTGAGATTFYGGGHTTSLPWTSISAQPVILSTLDGVANDEGNIDLIPGANMTITWA